MVGKLFRDRPPTRGTSLLDPGCATGEFIDGVIRWCSVHRAPLPRIVGVESDSRHATAAKERFSAISRVSIQHRDFLTPSDGAYDYIVGNPPYVPITDLTSVERQFYRQNYTTAQGRFDLYLLFFEQALRLLKPEGRLVFITPEKFLYVDTATPLRALLGKVSVEELHFLSEDTFGGLITYPLVSTVTASARSAATHIIDRSSSARSVELRGTDCSWLPVVLGSQHEKGVNVLADACLRISCGVATGADSVFVVPTGKLSPELRSFAYPTIAGRELAEGKAPYSSQAMLAPYDCDGRLLHENQLGGLGHYLSHPERRELLLARTCVARKPWYAFHETPPVRGVLRPKLLCKDIGAEPFFVIDRTGDLMPRHSVYYIVPLDPACLDELAAHLNSPFARRWLRDNCQRAANGFIRLQSNVLKRLPVPRSLVPTDVGVARPDLVAAGSA
jgi:adenine-specific DNA-methyltransferase